MLCTSLERKDIYSLAKQNYADIAVIPYRRRTKHLNTFKIKEKLYIQSRKLERTNLSHKNVYLLITCFVINFEGITEKVS